jgi:twitching motility protein PilT
VLSTVHGANVTMAIERVLDAFSGEEKQHAQHQLAGALRFVVAQALLPGVDGGRVPVIELLSATYAVGALIREGRTHMLSTQLETGGEHGMVPMERSLVELVRAGRVTRAAALAAAPNRETLLPLLSTADDGRTRRKA